MFDSGDSAGQAAAGERIALRVAEQNETWSTRVLEPCRAGESSTYYVSDKGAIVEASSRPRILPV